MGDNTDKPDEVDEHTYGTAPKDAPITRADFERTVRALHTSDMLIRDQLLHLAAQVVALTDEVTRRLDGVEPKPAPPGTPAPPPITTVENMVAMTTPEHLHDVRVNDAFHEEGVSYDDVSESKYDVVAQAPPCEELIPLCQARCCQLRFALSTEDLDEGIVRWDYGRPYLIRQRESDGRCVHNDPETKFCTVHAVRPRVCRTYHCQNDPRIWIDYEKRIPAPDPNENVRKSEFDAVARARQRTVAMFHEAETISNSFPEKEPRRGPKPR